MRTGGGAGGGWRMGRKERMRMDDERVQSVRIRGEMGNTGGTRTLQVNI